MITFAPAKPEDMVRRAAEGNAARRAASPGTKAQRPRNLAAVLSLDGTDFFTFRGRVYAVPPLAWRDGEALQDAYTRALDCAHLIAQNAAVSPNADRVLMAEYYEAVAVLPAMLWKLCGPASRMRRAARRLGMLRNPFAVATERELLELAGFFCERRTRSGVTFPRVTGPHGRATS